MSHQRISINNTQLLQRVCVHTYYTGEARKSSGLPPQLTAQLQASNSNRDILTQHINLSIAEATKMLTRYLGICTAQRTSPEETTIDIETPVNYPAECVPQIKEAIEDYCIMRTLGQWLTQIKPDEANAAANEAQMAMMRLRELMCIRKRPRCTNSSSDNSIEL